MYDPLEREYGIILSIAGPILMERAYWMREMAQVLEDDGSPKSAQMLRMNADRAEETIKQLGKKNDNKR